MKNCATAAASICAPTRMSNSLANQIEINIILLSCFALVLASSLLHNVRAMHSLVLHVGADFEAIAWPIVTALKLYKIYTYAGFSFCSCYYLLLL